MFSNFALITKPVSFVSASFRNINNRCRDSSDFKNLRIPLAVYLSDSYKKERPKIASLLEQNKNKPFSNDLLYNLLCSIIDIESNYFDESESIASPKYKFDFSNVKTNYGKAFVKDDPYNTNPK